MIQIEHDRENDLACRVSGRMSKAGSDAVVPDEENERELRRRPLRLMIVVGDFRGWGIEAPWEDLQFDVKYRDGFGRIAVVGTSKPEEWGTHLVAGSAANRLALPMSVR